MVSWQRSNRVNSSRTSIHFQTIPFGKCMEYFIFHYSIILLLVIINFQKLILFTNPSARAGYDTRSIFKRSWTGLNSDFSFSYTSSLTKAKKPSLSYYLPIAGGRIGFIPFPRVLVLCEMQSVSSRIWTRVTVSNSYDDNHYSTGTSFVLNDISTSKSWYVIENKERKAISWIFS